jgi:hypothetical protein
MACQYLTQSSLFQGFMTLVVVLNSLVLAVSDPKSRSPNLFQSAIEVGFFSAYVLEMTLKVLGFGLISYRRSYLRDPWNLLDLFVISATAASLSGFSITRANSKPIYFSSLKIISPLRAIKSIPKLKFLIKAIIDSLPSLFDMLKVILLIFGCFAVFGLQFFQKVFEQKCVDLKDGKASFTFDGGNLCGGAATCPQNSTCVHFGERPVSGMYSFDNIFSSYLTVFIITTLEGWSQVEYFLILGSSWWSIIYVSLVVLIGAFVLMNLALSIIVEKFTEIQDEKDKNADLNIRNLTRIINSNRR